MQPEEMILVSVDDHLVEPPNLFEGRVVNKYADETPRVIRQSDGSEVWTFNGAIIPNIGLNAVAGRPREEYGIEPTAFDEMRPGCYDIHGANQGHGRGRCARVDVLPVLSRLRGPAVRHPPR